MAQDVGMVESIVVSFPSSLVGFWGFHPYMCLFSFRKLFCDFLYQSSVSITVTSNIVLSQKWNQKCMFTNLILLNVPLTSACCIHSNVYGLGNIHCIRYHTRVHSSYSTSPPVHVFHHLTWGTVEIPPYAWCCTGKCSTIGEGPISHGRPHFTGIRMSATSS